MNINVWSVMNDNPKKDNVELVFAAIEWFVYLNGRFNLNPHQNIVKNISKLLKI